MASPEGGPIRIYPWEISATGEFDQEQLELLHLADVDYLVEWLNEKPYGIMISLMEILGHGHIRRAVQIARGLVQVNPTNQARFDEVMPDPKIRRYWFETPLEEIPEGPSEIQQPKDYVQ